MAYTTINKFTDNFNTVTYSNAGDGAKAVTGVGFQPDLVWVKNRTVAYHPQFHDSVRGASSGSLYTSTTGAIDTGYPISSFDSNGFTTGSQSSNESQNSANQVAWNWKAGTTGSGTTGGSGTSKTYNYSVNTTAGFSIVKYEGNGTNNHQIPHHLGAVPKMIIFKNFQSGYSWDTYHIGIGNAHRLYFNSNVAKQSATNYLNSTTPTSTYINLGDAGHTNDNGTNHIAYCFAEKTGYSKIGTYKGNGSSSAPAFIYTGFKPKFVLIKCTNEADEWFIHDDKRDGYNDDNEYLFASLNNVEGTNTNRIRLLSNGFSVPTTDKSHNKSGNTYIYMAIGQSLVGSNNTPCTAR